MRHGPGQKFKKQTSQLEEYDQASGCGVYRFPEGAVPGECAHFIMEQFRRLDTHIPDRFRTVPEEMNALIHAAGYAAQSFCNSYNAYTIFMGITDVEETDDWQRYAYTIRDSRFGSDEELAPENVETFVFVPGQDLTMFESAMRNPGLDALPLSIGRDLRAWLEENELPGSGDPEHAYLPIWWELDLETRRFCQDYFAMVGPDGTMVLTEDGRSIFDEHNFNAYCDVIMWASFIWFLGPPGRDYRRSICEIFEVCATDGECIIAEGTVLGADWFQKWGRPPRSCHKCDLDAWCVEATSGDASLKYICEKCFSKGLPVEPPANCGSRICRWQTCPYHPFHDLGREGLKEMRRQHGQLTGRAWEGSRERRVLAGDEQRRAALELGWGWLGKGD